MSQNPNVAALVDRACKRESRDTPRQGLEQGIRISDSDSGDRVQRASCWGLCFDSPWSVREKHIRYLMHLWVDKSGQRPTVVLSKLAHWRNLAKKMRKAQLLAIVEDYINKPGGYGRRDAQQNGTTRDQLYIHVDDVVARLAEQDRWVSVQVEPSMRVQLAAGRQHALSAVAVPTFVGTIAYS